MSRFPHIPADAKAPAKPCRPTYACTCKACIRTATMPAQPLPGSRASAALLAHVMVSKYLDGLPLYRQEKIAARAGLDLPRAKLARWLIKASKVFQPLVNLLNDTFFSYDIAHSDDTGIQVLKEGGRHAASQSALWIRRGGPPDQPVVLVRRNPATPRADCCLTSGAPWSVMARPASTWSPAVRACRWPCVTTMRGATSMRSVSAWDDFIDWAERVQREGVSHAGTRDALSYLLKHADGLRYYCNDGRIQISNIRAEHVAKTIAIARKNFLFADTTAGTEASGRIFSLIETARANGHNPQRYLTVLLNALPNVSMVDEIEALLPWHLTPPAVDDQYAAYLKP